jgi:hypothetical protein
MLSKLNITDRRRSFTIVAAIVLNLSSVMLPASAAAAPITDGLAGIGWGATQVTAPPIFNLSSGTYQTPQQVTIKCATPGAVIYYTVDGSQPTTSSRKYTGPFTLATNGTVKAIAEASKYAASALRSITLAITQQAAMPTLSLASGTYTQLETVTLSDSTAGAKIYYTLNGSLPQSSWTLYTAPISLTSSAKVSAYAVATNFKNSNVASGNYTLNLNTPAPGFSVAPGTYKQPVKVALTDAMSNATIYYSLSATLPIAQWTKYTTPIAVNTSATVYSYATAPYYNASPSAQAAYAISNAPATPVISLKPGTYTTIEKVSVTDATANTVIYYTLNDSLPKSAWTLYTGPVQLPNGYSKLSAYAAVAGAPNSAVAFANYDSVLNTPAPTFSVAAGTYKQAITVSLSDSLSGSTIYYTESINLPQSQWTRYTAPISVNATSTIYAYASAQYYNSSMSSQATYTIQNAPAVPVLSLAPGTYTTLEKVSLSDVTPGATIYYTLNDSLPKSAWTVYTGPVQLPNGYSKLSAYAAVAGAPNSAVAYANYNSVLNTPAPTFSVAAGTYKQAITVSLSDSLSGSTIYYTESINLPQSQWTKYTAPISVNATSTIYAYASAQYYNASMSSQATYTIQNAPAIPVLSLAPGTYTTIERVTLTDATPGAKIYYTMKDSLPQSSWTPYAGPIQLPNGYSKVSAYAAVAGTPNSAVAYANYALTLNTPTPTFSVAAGTYTQPITVTLSDALSSAIIYYSFSATTPQAQWTQYTQPIPVGTSNTIYAYAAAQYYNPSLGVKAGYNIQNPAATPVFSVPAGNYTQLETVAISDSTPNAQIYYTLDSTVPQSSWTLYSQPIVLAASAKLSAYATANNYQNSAVAQANYSLSLITPSPSISVAAGTYTQGFTVTLTDSMPGAVIYYAFSATTPTAQWTQYTQPIAISSTETLYTYAVAPKYSNSANAQAAYIILTSTAPPTLSPAPGAYTTSQAIVLQSTTNNAVIYYTLDGSIPTTASNVYTSPIILTSSATVRAMATAQGYSNSTVQTGNYSISSQNSNGTPPGSAFVPPAANLCQSNYDQFYETEPGVFAFWALCEPGANAQPYDYVGMFDLTAPLATVSAGTWTGGVAGPVNDGETAMATTVTNASIANQGMPLNSNQGTVAVWVSGTVQSVNMLRNAVELGSVAGSSDIKIALSSASGGDLCFNGVFTNSAGTTYQTQNCGYGMATWHRVAFTWSSGALALYVDGQQVSQSTYTGGLDNQLFLYRLFAPCCGTGTQITMAKVGIANQAWSSTQAATDFAPTLPQVPSGGVYVSGQTLGTIHKAVLGYGDRNQDISTPAAITGLTSGMQQLGAGSVRYGGGYGGIDADYENWQGGVICTTVPGVTAAARNLTTNNNLDAYMQNVVQPLGLQTVFTVNYGTNPPFCDAGGDPIANGANLVQYANFTNSYGIKRFEIGNEVYSNSTETDFHTNPNMGASYAANEPAYYNAMKAIDPTIQIGVPIGLTTYGWQQGFDYPVFSGASYDAVIFHNYPVADPVTDGDTLYQDRVASSLKRTHGELLKLQTELLNFNKAPDAIWTTEWNEELFGDRWSKQTLGAVAPLFVVSQLAQYMEAGVQVATWWDQGRPNGCTMLNYDPNGETAYSWWECGSTSLVYAGPTIGAGELGVGLTAGELTPAGRGFQILSESGFVTEGEHTVLTQNDVQGAPWLQSYAATHSGAYAVILINRDRDQAHTVPVSIANQTSGSAVDQWTYGRTQYDATRNGDWSQAPVHTTSGSWSGTYTATLPPWSVSVIVFSK